LSDSVLFFCDSEQGSSCFADPALPRARLLPNAFEPPAARAELDMGPCRVDGDFLFRVVGIRTASKYSLIYKNRMFKLQKYSVLLY
jgi:hypothetical protein